MSSNPKLDRFLSRLASVTADGPVYAPDETDVKRIVLFDPPVGAVVGQFQELGETQGQFCRFPGGEVRFQRVAHNDTWYYVNRGMAEFQSAARIFNAFCWSANDPDDPECSYFEEMKSRFRQALEQIEPLGDSGMSLWSATIHDTEAGLWTLY